MRTLLAFLLVLAFSLPALADPVMGTFVRGSVAAIEVRTAPLEFSPEGFLIRVPTASIGLLDDDGLLVHCEDIGPDEQRIMEFTPTGNANGWVGIWIVAYNNPGPSEPAVDVSYFHFLPPRKPWVVK
jgi:hypothetical protein